ncbi:MAG: DNA-binding protein, partial [Prevotella sp.]|nr:DNA-binding protein [Prevotella sp.]
MKKFILILIICVLSIKGQAATPFLDDNQGWYDALSSPNKQAKPWTFWYWMYGCVTSEGIRADLNAMKDAGIVGFYLMPIKDTSDAPEYEGTARQLSQEWFKMIDTTFSLSDSLGLEMGIHFSDGFALAGGPWITPEESMQKVVWSDTIISGGKRNVQLFQPTSFEGYYEDIAVYAYPAFYEDSSKPKVSVDLPLSTSEPTDIVMSYDKPFTLRRVQIITGNNNYQAHRFKIYSSQDGTNYTFIKEITPARQGWQNTDAYATYAIPTTTAKYFKFFWTPEGSDPGSEDMDAAKWKPNLKIANIILGSEPVIDGYEGKSGIVWRVSKYFGIEDDECVKKEDIIDLTKEFLASKAENKPLEVNLPKGKWHILRMGHTSTGHTNATGGGAKGLECDKFSRGPIDKQFDGWFSSIYNHVPKDVAKRVLTRLHVDSWECGSQNWSEDFANEFEKRRGYNLLPWLPLYAGVPISSAEKSEEVLRDVRLTIAELIDEVFFDEVEKLARCYDCKLSTECVAPTMVSDGLLHYKHADYPMGEFWLNSPTHDKPNDMLDAISGAHIYGKNFIQAEGFTEVRGTWDEHPGMLKALLDRNYCLGINSIVFHVNTLNPWLDRSPGMTLDGIGTFFQRDNTWWREMPSFTSYISRCQALLQYGEPVVDLAVYIGDEIPRRSILPERLITTLPGLFGREAINKENERLSNQGQPIEISPVGVTHTKNMTKADMWTNPLKGYHYDSFNHDVLDSAEIENGELLTKDGMKYSIFVVPQERKMNPDRIVNCWDKIDSLEAKGLKVIRTAWEKEDLSSLGIGRDIILPDGLDFTHRKAKDADIYFISNQLE